MPKGKDTNAEQPQEVAAAAKSIETLQAEIAGLKDLLEVSELNLEDAKAELAIAKAAFEQYKADAQAILSESAPKVIVSDKPLLEVDGEMYVFKMGKLVINGKSVAATDIISNPAAYKAAIQDMIHKFKILKPFKTKEV